LKKKAELKNGVLAGAATLYEAVSVSTNLENGQISTLTGQKRPFIFNILKLKTLGENRNYFGPVIDPSHKSAICSWLLAEKKANTDKTAKKTILPRRFAPLGTNSHKNIRKGQTAYDPRFQ